MIRKTTIQHHRKPVTLTELTVGQIWCLLADGVGVNENFSALAVSTGMSEDALKRIAATDQDRLQVIWSAFLDMHRELFAEKADGKNPRAKAGKESRPTDIFTQLNESVCRLIEAGHSRVFDYGYSFFAAAVKASGAIRHERMRALAIAVRTAHHADKKNFEKFMAGLKS